MMTASEGWFELNIKARVFCFFLLFLTVECMVVSTADLGVMDHISAILYSLFKDKLSHLESYR